MTDITDKEFDEALDRIARTPDGVLLYRFCQKQLMGTLAEHAPKQGALRAEHGMRRFAAQLMSKMVKGIDESGGRTDLSDSRASERTVVIRRGAEPSRSGQHTNIRDALRRSDPEWLGIAARGGNDGGSTG